MSATDNFEKSCQSNSQHDSELSSKFLHKILEKLESIEICQKFLQKSVHLLNKENLKRVEEIKSISRKEDQLITDDDYQTSDG